MNTSIAESPRKPFRIALSQTLFTDRQIRVCGADTVFADAHCSDLITRSEFEAAFKTLLKKCRTAKCRLSRVAYFDLLADFSEYESDMKLSYALFAEYAEMWKKIVADGLFAPVMDNEELKAAGKVRARLEALYWRNKPISKVQDMFDRMKRHASCDMTNCKSIRL